jgi:2'-5' RNA ligase
VADRGVHRLFVAMQVPDDTRRAVETLLAPVRALSFDRPPRWVRADTLHVTLRFLGDTPAELVPDVALAVRDAVEDAAPFDVRLAGAGSFPRHGAKVRTLWLGIENGGRALGELSAAVTAAVVPLGWPADARPFSPHLTVARTDASSIADGRLASQAIEAAADGWTSTFRADTVVVYRSVLGGGPPRHEPIETIELRAQPG